MNHTDPRARALAEARQDLDRDEHPAALRWDDLSPIEQQLHTSVADAWIRSAIAAGIMAPAAVVSSPTSRAAVLSDAERTMLTYALDQAQERIWSEDGFTDEDQAAVDSLRRLAAEAQQQPGEPVVEAHRLALSEALHLGNGAPWQAILDRAGDLSRRDVEAQQQPAAADDETRQAHAEGEHAFCGPECDAP